MGGGANLGKVGFYLIEWVFSQIQTMPWKTR